MNFTLKLYLFIFEQKIWRSPSLKDMNFIFYYIVLISYHLNSRIKVSMNIHNSTEFTTEILSPKSILTKRAQKCFIRLPLLLADSMSSKPNANQVWLTKLHFCFLIMMLDYIIYNTNIVILGGIIMFSNYSTILYPTWIFFAPVWYQFLFFYIFESYVCLLVIFFNLNDVLGYPISLISKSF